MKSLVALAVMAFVAVAASAADRATLMKYYASLDGLKKAELKAAVHALIKPTATYSYGSGSGGTWAAFYDLDYEESAKGRLVRDRYSSPDGWTVYKSQGAVPSGLNIEHSFPKSWWGGSSSPNAYRDVFNLMPCESGINSTKSNYGMGVVASGDKGNGFTKVGKDASGNNVWEPDDRWKGDFARGYMYMATAYQDLTWTLSGEAGVTLEQNTWPTLKEWAYKLYIAWAKADAVDEIETVRNDAVYASKQNNRNPFIDFPNLMEYIWGDSTDVAFPLASTVCAYDAQISDGRTAPTFRFEETTVYATLGADFDAPVLVSTTDAVVTFASSDESVATVDAATGEVTLVAAGTVEITATAPATDAYRAATASYTLRVIDPSVVVEEDVASFDFSPTDYRSKTGAFTDPITIDPITVQFAKGTGAGTTTDPAWYVTNNVGHMRLYRSGTLTVTSVSAPITKIEIEFTAAGYTPSESTWAADAGEFEISAETLTWTGETSKVVFTNTAGSSHVRIKAISVTYGEAATPTDPSTGISAVATESTGARIVFDLQGRRVVSPRAGGVYIVNGRKVVVR